MVVDALGFIIVSVGMLQGQDEHFRLSGQGVIRRGGVIRVGGVGGHRSFSSTGEGGRSIVSFGVAVDETTGGVSSFCSLLKREDFTESTKE